MFRPQANRPAGTQGLDGYVDSLPVGLRQPFLGRHAHSADPRAKTSNAKGPLFECVTSQENPFIRFQGRTSMTRQENPNHYSTRECREHTRKQKGPAGTAGPGWDGAFCLDLPAGRIFQFVSPAAVSRFLYSAAGGLGGGCGAAESFVKWPKR